MWSWGFAWDGAGRLADRLDPRGVRTATTYRPEGWVDDIAYSYPGLADETVDYRVYDALGNPQRIDFPEGITQPRYDARSQVVTGAYGVSGTNETFRYDRDRNRVHRKRAGVEQEYVIGGADQLREIRRLPDGLSQEQLFYDDAGRRVARFGGSSGVTGYAYDGLGRLTAVLDITTGYQLTLEYDPLGNRIRRTERLTAAAVSETTLFLLGLVELRGVDAQGQAAETVRWIPGPGPGGVVAEVSAGPSAQAPVLWSLLGDAAGNVVRMARVDAAPGGALATTRASVRYAAFGEQIQSSGSAPTERRFAGMLSEGASGLVHMGARHYDPRVGAFLQPDPLGIAAVATYAYAANNPYRFVDPSGLDPFSIAGDFGFSFPAGGSGFGGSSSISLASGAQSGPGGFGSGAGSGFARPQFDPNPVALLDPQRPCGSSACDFNPVNSAAVVAAPLGLSGVLGGFAAFQASNLPVLAPLAGAVISTGVRNLGIQIGARLIVARNVALATAVAGANRGSQFVRDPANQIRASDFVLNASVGFEQGQSLRFDGQPLRPTPFGVAGFRVGQGAGVLSTVSEALPALIARFSD